MAKKTVIRKSVDMRYNNKKDLKIFSLITEKISQLKDLKTTLTEILKILKSVTECHHLAIRIIDPQGNIPFYAQLGLEKEFLDSEHWVTVDDCLCGYVARGQVDKKLSFITDYGSFYTNSATDFLTWQEENSFDTILCAEVLEHIPFEYFEKSLEELQKITKKWVVLSLPHFGIRLKFSFKIPKLQEKNVLLKIPYRKEHRFNGEHYWEIGKRGYSLDKILKIISGHFKVDKYYFLPENAHHMFFC